MDIKKFKRDELFNIVKDKILPANIVVDLGCGIRPQEFIIPKYHICVDPHNQYLEYLKKKYRYKSTTKYSFLNADWSQAIQIFPENSIETIFLLDVIEHLEKDVALRLLEITKRIITKQIVIFTPLGFIEQRHETDKDAWGLDGGRWQEHKSGWLPEDFGEGWQFFVCEDFHTHNNLGIKYDKPKGAFFAIFNSVKKINKNKPIFTVVVPTYNQAQYLGEALDSLINQTFPLWEAIIVNDGSTDNTKEVIEKYLSLDKRFKAIHKENGGVASALNTGIKHAQGEWISWLSSDDFFEPNKLEIHFNAIIENPDIKFFHTAWNVYLEDSKQKIAPIIWYDIPPVDFQVISLLKTNYINGISIAIHKSVFENIGYFDEKLLQGQDFDMWLRISSKYKRKFIFERTCTTRIHKGQTTFQFLEGGILDSSYSIIKFINENPFEALFPFTNLKDIEKLTNVLFEIVKLSSKKDAFLYKSGFTSIHIKKTLEWINNNFNKSQTHKIFQILEIMVNEFLKVINEDEIRHILKLFVMNKFSGFRKLNFVEHLINQINLMIRKGEQDHANILESYLSRFIKLNNQIVEYSPIFDKSKSIQKHFDINIGDIIFWNIEPSNIFNSIIHILKLKCGICENEFNIKLKIGFEKVSSSKEFICPKCYNIYKYTDSNLADKLVKYNEIKIGTNIQETSMKKNLAFFIKSANIIGGGTKVFFKYIEWLNRLGNNIIVYSFSKMPEWFKYNVKFIKIKNINDIKNDSIELLTFFSIFDLPLLLNILPINKLIHFCQGYEGYHYGYNFENVLEDKHLFNELHKIPVKLYAVSTHLVKLFREKFGRDVVYVPNSINHKYFYPFEFDSQKQEPTILFVGDPSHPLKGFDFLAASLKILQNSSLRINNLKLKIIVGFSSNTIYNFHKYHEQELKCEIIIKEKLSTYEMANEIRSSSVVVCTSWYEGFSLPLLEAMACGIPVITTKNGGAESYCVNNYNSFIVEYGDSENFIKYIVNILNNKIDLKKILRNAYRTSLQFNEHESVKALINAYEKFSNKKYPQEVVDKFINEIRNKSFVNKTINKLLTGEVSFLIFINYNVDTIKYYKELLKKYGRLVKEIIVIISSDNDKLYQELLEENYKNIELVLHSDESKLPEKINLGLAKVTGDLIFIMNGENELNDEIIYNLIEIADSDSIIGAVGITNNKFRKENQYLIDLKDEPINNLHKYYKGNNNYNVNDTLFVSLIKKEVIEKIGGYDERYYLKNYMDYDFYLRARLADFKVIILRDYIINHLHSNNYIEDYIKQSHNFFEMDRKTFINKWEVVPDENIFNITVTKKHDLIFPMGKNLFKHYFERTKLSLAERELDLAQESIVKALENYTDYESATIQKDELLNIAGNIFLANNNISKAQEYFEKELNLNPQSSSACYGLGNVFISQGNYEAAKIMFEWAVKNDPDNQKAKDALGKVNSLLGYELSHSSLDGG